MEVCMLCLKLLLLAFPPGIYVQETQAPVITGVPTSYVAFVGMAQSHRVPAGEPTLVTNWGQFATQFGEYDRDKAPYLAPAVQGFFANGGQRCYVVRAKSMARNEDYMGTAGTGLSALAGIDDVSIVCVPGVTSTAVQRAVLKHCQETGDRFCILDSAKGATVDEVIAQRQALASSKGFGALYHPWIAVSVKGQREEVFVPPSGHIAGLYARTDLQRGVHKAPAGTSLTGALRLEADLSEDACTRLYEEQINPIRAFPQKGIVVWGARTLADDPEWRYVSVRRLAIYIEQSIRRGTEWAVLEPNEQALWDKVRASVTAFLTVVWKDGGLAGSRRQEAFFVRCDNTTMTQADIDRGQLVILVGFAPLKPAEFMLIKICLITGN
jgi:phage tail sheath protein FI